MRAFAKPEIVEPPQGSLVPIVGVELDEVAPPVGKLGRSGRIPGSPFEEDRVDTTRRNDGCPALVIGMRILSTRTTTTNARPKARTWHALPIRAAQHHRELEEVLLLHGVAHTDPTRAIPARWLDSCERWVVIVGPIIDHASSMLQASRAARTEAARNTCTSLLFHVCRVGSRP